jgi:hypothetical protein
MPLREVLVAIAGVGPLRRVLAATTIAALGTGGLLVVAVVFGARRGGHTGGGPLLAAAFGIGGLAGSLALTVRPLRTEPERTTLALMAATGASVALCALAPDQAAAAVLFALAGAVAAAQFTASLAVRSAYTPPGTRAHVYVTMASVKVAAPRPAPLSRARCSRSGPGPRCSPSPGSSRPAPLRPRSCDTHPGPARHGKGEGPVGRDHWRKRHIFGRRVSVRAGAAINAWPVAGAAL